MQLKIASGAFHSCSGLRKVTLPENLVSLGKYAFGYCTNLTEVEVYATASKPDETDSSVMLCTALETDAFRTDVAWDKDNTRKAYSVTRVTIGANVGVMDLGGVFGSALQQSTSTPKTPTLLRTTAWFTAKTSRRSCSIPLPERARLCCTGDVETISAGVFAKAAYLTEITLGAKVSKISENAFNVKIYNSSVSDNSLKITSALTKVNFATEVADGHTLTIGDSAFEECKLLKSLTCRLRVGNRRQSFCTLHGLTEVTIPGSAKTLGDEVFASCTGLETATFEEGVETIGVKLFIYCGGKLKTVNLPSTLTSIAIDDNEPFVNMFSNCDSVSSVNIAEGNEKYASIDGIVYGYTLKGEDEDNKQNVLTDLLYCP